MIKLSKRETTLRQLVFMCLKEKLKNDGMTRTELHELTDYVLDNSTLELSADNLELYEGNMFGVGNENKDKPLTIPRFLAFTYSRATAFKFFLRDKKKSWSLDTFSSFDNLPSSLIFQGEDVILLIDGEIVGYKVKNGEDVYMNDVVFDKDIYSISCVLEDEEHEEFLRSKRDLETRVIELVEQKAKSLNIENLITGEDKFFEIRKNVYTNRMSKPEDFDALDIIWVREVEDDDFEDEG